MSKNPPETIITERGTVISFMGHDGVYRSMKEYTLIGMDCGTELSIESQPVVVEHNLIPTKIQTIEEELGLGNRKSRRAFKSRTKDRKFKL